jgi:hypothetical protein
MKPYAKDNPALIKFAMRTISLYLTLLLVLYSNISSSILYAKSKTHPEQPYYTLAICAIFQNEARFLKEWIEYHRLVGVEQFFLYNNCSSDDYAAVLNPYIEKGIVTLRQWKKTADHLIEWQSIQRKAYNDALKKYGKRTQWMAFIDIDEYIVPVEAASLPTFLQNYQNYGGLSVNSLLFGDASVDHLAPNQLCIQMLTQRAPDMYWEHVQIKPIIQTHCVRGFYNETTLPEYRYPYFQVNVSYQRTNGPLVHLPETDTIRIHHYWIGDRAHFNYVKWPRYARWYPKMDFQRKLQITNSVTDTTMSRFIPLLLLQLESHVD